MAQGEYSILDFGAVRGGIEDSAGAIQAAIDAAGAAGGGRVTVPQGVFLSGSLFLKSHVELHLEAGARLVCSLDEKHIKSFPTRAGGEGLDGWSGGFFIGTAGAEDVTISGSGVIDGQGTKVFFERDEDGGFRECPKAAAVFRPRLLMFEDVQNLTVRGVTLRDAAFWTFHMAGCRRVLVDGIRIINDERGVNNDGIDPDSCRDVIIRGCLIQTGDDAIVVKSTAAMSARYGACENIIISDCILRSHCTAFKIGSETCGAIRNIMLSNCVLEGTRTVGIWMRDGGTIENITAHHVTGAARRYADCDAAHGGRGWWGKGEALFVSATPRTAEKPFPGAIRNISFDHMTLTAESSIFIAGEGNAPICGVRLSDIKVTFRKTGTQPGGLFDEQPGVRGMSPHKIPALYARCVRGLSVSRCTVRDAGGTSWSGAVCETEDCDAADADIKEVKN